jgi:hypothetical protein
MDMVRAYPTLNQALQAIPGWRNIVDPSLAEQARVTKGELYPSNEIRRSIVTVDEPVARDLLELNYKQYLRELQRQSAQAGFKNDGFSRFAAAPDSSVLLQNIFEGKTPRKVSDYESTFLSDGLRPLVSRKLRDAGLTMSDLLAYNPQLINTPETANLNLIFKPSELDQVIRSKDGTVTIEAEQARAGMSPLDVIDAAIRYKNFYTTPQPINQRTRIVTIGGKPVTVQDKRFVGRDSGMSQAVGLDAAGNPFLLPKRSDEYKTVDESVLDIDKGIAQRKLYSSDDPAQNPVEAYGVWDEGRQQWNPRWTKDVPVTIESLYQEGGLPYLQQDLTSQKILPQSTNLAGWAEQPQFINQAWELAQSGALSPEALDDLNKLTRTTLGELSYPFAARKESAVSGLDIKNDWIVQGVPTPDNVMGMRYSQEGYPIDVRLDPSYTANTPETSYNPASFYLDPAPQRTQYIRYQTVTNEAGNKRPELYQEYPIPGADPYNLTRSVIRSQGEGNLLPIYSRLNKDGTETMLTPPGLEELEALAPEGYLPAPTGNSELVPYIRPEQERQVIVFDGKTKQIPFMTELIGRKQNPNAKPPYIWKTGDTYSYPMTTVPKRVFGHLSGDNDFDAAFTPHRTDDNIYARQGGAQADPAVVDVMSRIQSWLRQQEAGLPRPKQQASVFVTPVSTDAVAPTRMQNTEGMLYLQSPRQGGLLSLDEARANLEALPAEQLAGTEPTLAYTKADKALSNLVFNYGEDVTHKINPEGKVVERVTPLYASLTPIDGAEEMPDFVSAIEGLRNKQKRLSISLQYGQDLPPAHRSALEQRLGEVTAQLETLQSQVGEAYKAQGLAENEALITMRQLPTAGDDEPTPANLRATRLYRQRVGIDPAPAQPVSTAPTPMRKWKDSMQQEIDELILTPEERGALNRVRLPDSYWKRDESIAPVERPITATVSMPSQEIDKAEILRRAMARQQLERELYRQR